MQTVEPSLDLEQLEQLASETAPVVESEQTPVVESEQTPVVESEQTPVVESEQTPVVESEQTPVVESEQTRQGETTQHPFAELGLKDSIVEAVSKLGFEEPTPIQAKAIPVLLAGNDVLGQAQTGTGKTAAFALPILNEIHLKKNRAQCLVLAPTRELAIQVGEAFEQFGESSKKLSVATICGGQEYNRQIRQLRKGAQVVVGTPGRVIDLIKKSELKLDTLKWCVLDEADEMLRMGFEEDVKWILSQTKDNVSMALFSATIPDQIREISNQYLTDPVHITIKKKTSTADTIDQKYLIAKGHQKKEALVRLLEGEEIDGVMIFVKTRAITEPLAEFIQTRLGYRVAAINGDIPQARREQIIENLKSGKIDIIVATDVAARGLDVDRISHVINYDLPQDVEGYVHRIGRTGRAGRKGCSVVFLQPNERGVLEKIEKSTRQKIQKLELPSNRQVNQFRVQRFHEAIVENLSHPHLEKYQSILEQMTSDVDMPLELVAASLAVMANDGKPFFQNADLKLPEFNSKENGRGRKGSRNEPSREAKRFGNRKSGNLKTYRIEIGRKHRVKPGNIVGAIANEAGIESDSIGRIKICDKFSFIDLPGSLTDEQLEVLGKVAIGKQSLRISLDQGQGRGRGSDGDGKFGGRSRRERKAKPYAGKKSKRGKKKK